MKNTDKMKRIVLLFLIIFAVGCGPAPLIEDPATLAQIEQRLAERSEWLPSFPADLSVAERQGLEFLYAYLPVGDVGQYGVDFFLSNVRWSLGIRQQMAWGAQIPEREFLHFVLPVRVGTEALDTARRTFYSELKGRVAGLSIEEAMVEVNHWCYAMVNYSPSDGRTMGPLALVFNATGRCGEQSALLVAALRSVGIPARQVYVPRWAHTEDNHAWVEAWAPDSLGGGRWHYMGACEPEAQLNRTRFDADAARALVVATKVFGHYTEGTSQVLERTDGTTEISVTERYAPVGLGRVVVRDQEGQPVEGARVCFSIYNSGAYYPVLRQRSNDRGEASIRAGLGGLVVSASKDGGWASGVVQLNGEVPLELVLGPLPDTVVEWHINPPIERPQKPYQDQEAIDRNKRRLAVDDSIRNTYIASFAQPAEQKTEWEEELALDSVRLWSVLQRARGNHHKIRRFLLNTQPDHRLVALDLLEILPDKDLCDTPSEVLSDHLDHSIRWADRQEFIPYILNPRVDNEQLVAYRTLFDRADTTIDAKAVIGGLWATAIVDSLNPARLPITPVGVRRVNMGDRRSVERMMIAALRSNGIAARREPISQRPQYFEQGVWHSFSVEGQLPAVGKGSLEVSIEPSNVALDPKLHTHFTMAQWDGSAYQPIELESLGATAYTVFSQPLALDPGRYMLTTATRLASGAALVRNAPVEVYADSVSRVVFSLPESTEQLNVIGSINPHTPYWPLGANASSSLLSTTGRELFLLAMIDTQQQACTEFLHTLAGQKTQLEQWGKPIVLVARSPEQLHGLDLSKFSELPSTAVFGADRHGAMNEMVALGCEIEHANRLPIVVLSDPNGQVLYISSGNNPHFDEQLTTIIEILEQKQ